MVSLDAPIIWAMIVFLLLIVVLNPLLFKPSDADRGRIFSRFVTKLGGNGGNE